MGKRSSQYAEGVHVYQHRVAKDWQGDPLVLIADARFKPVIDNDTGQQKVDPITGQPIVTLANPYGFELHRMCAQQPHIWEETTAAPIPEQSKGAPRATIAKKAPEESAPDPEPDPDKAPAEQEPAAK